MQINGINGAQSVNPTSQVESAKATQATSITTPTDQVDISAEAELNSQTIEMIDQLQIQDLPEIRTDRVARFVKPLNLVHMKQKRSLMLLLIGYSMKSVKPAILIKVNLCQCSA